MPFDLPETNRVQSIKNKFENLNYLQTVNITNTNQSSKNDWTKGNTRFKFQRSATSIDLLSFRMKKTSESDTNNKITSKKGGSASDDEIDTLKPLNEIKENIEIRFSRHTNDPVKRSSIKRSPAFRVGDKVIKNLPMKQNQNESINEQKSIDVSNRKTESRKDFYEANLTDTLKAVLKQPLPVGPPPKKPPRIFADSLNSNRNVCNMNSNDIAKQTDMQSIIKLEIKSKTEKQLSATKPFRKNLLKCIPCSSSPIYDFAQQVLEKDSNEKINSDNGKTEPIYMEPFAHLKLNHCLNASNKNSNRDKLLASFNQNKMNTAKSTDSESLDLSLTSCTSCTSEDHSLSDFNNDIHYMVSYTNLSTNFTNNMYV